VNCCLLQNCLLTCITSSLGPLLQGFCICELFSTPELSTAQHLGSPLSENKIKNNCIFTPREKVKGQVVGSQVNVDQISVVNTE
jgi:hypothetical protein